MECISATSDSGQSVAEHKQPVGPSAVVKGFLSFNTLAFTHVRPDVTIQVVRRLDVWKFCLALRLQAFVVNFDKEISESR